MHYHVQVSDNCSISHAMHFFVETYTVGCACAMMQRIFRWMMKCTPLLCRQSSGSLRCNSRSSCNKQTCYARGIPCTDCHQPCTQLAHAARAIARQFVPRIAVGQMEVPTGGSLQWKTYLQRCVGGLFQNCFRNVHRREVNIYQGTVDNQFFWLGQNLNDQAQKKKKGKSPRYYATLELQDSKKKKKGCPKKQSLAVFRSGFKFISGTKRNRHSSSHFEHTRLHSKQRTELWPTTCHIPQEKYLALNTAKKHCKTHWSRTVILVLQLHQENWWECSPQCSAAEHLGHRTNAAGEHNCKRNIWWLYSTESIHTSHYILLLDS